jgi:hypothetical protein
VTIIIVASFLFPIIKGLVFGFSSFGLKKDVEGILGYLSFVIAIFIGIGYVKNSLLGNGSSMLSSLLNYMPKDIVAYFQDRPILIYVVIIPIIIFIMAKIFNNILNFICSLTIFHLIDVLEEVIRNKNYVVRRIVGGIVQLPKAICYLLVCLIVLNVASMFNVNNNLNSYIDKSSTYEYLCKKLVIPITNSSIAKQLPEVINDSLKIVVKQQNRGNSQLLDQQDSTSNSQIQQGTSNLSDTIIYYNGVTLAEGIKSDAQIDNFAKNITVGQKTTLDKAYKLYNWEGQNISYDYDKANKVLNDDYNVQSGAIPAFNSKKGICFDYACLYVAMCRANNIKVRMVTGEGFNGASWVSHAWNMVYLPENNTWINVDTTFAKGGNYFNSKMFDLDHRNAQIIGQW